MLALTVSVAGASYGQDGSIVYKGDAFPNQYWNGRTNLPSWYANDTGEYWIRTRQGLKKYDALGKFVTETLFPFGIAQYLTDPAKPFMVHTDGTITIAGDRCFRITSQTEWSDFSTFISVHRSADKRELVRFPDKVQEYKSGQFVDFITGIEQGSFVAFGRDKKYFTYTGYNGLLQQWDDLLPLSQRTISVGVYGSGLVGSKYSYWPSGNVSYGITAVNAITGSGFTRLQSNGSLQPYLSLPAIWNRVDSNIMAFDGGRVQTFTPMLILNEDRRQIISNGSFLKRDVNGRLYTANTNHNLIYSFTDGGAIVKDVKLNDVVNYVHRDTFGILYVWDASSIRKYSENGVFIEQITSGYYYSSNGYAYKNNITGVSEIDGVIYVQINNYKWLAINHVSKNYDWQQWSNTGIDLGSSALLQLKSKEIAILSGNTILIYDSFDRRIPVFSFSAPGNIYFFDIGQNSTIWMSGSFTFRRTDGTDITYPFAKFDPMTGEEVYFGAIGEGPGMVGGPVPIVASGNGMISMYGSQFDKWGPDGDFLLPSTSFSLSPEPTTDGWNRSAVKATLSGKDNAGGSGFKELRYTLDTNAQQTSTNATTNVDISGDGSHTLVFQSVDQAGNVEAAQTKTIKIDSVLPQSSASINSTRDQVTITATDDRAGVKTIYYSVDGGPEQVYGGPFAITVGPHTITYRAEDKAGNVESSRSLVTGIVVSSVELNQASVLGGGSVTATVKLTAAAPAGGAVVNITSANASATVPSTVNIAAGQSNATFTVSTTPVAVDTDVKLEASANDTKASVTLKVLAPAPATLTLAPTSVRGGANSTGTVTLNGPAPTGGIIVSLSSNKSDATVPQSLTVAAGETTKTFTVTTTPVVNETAASISATTAGGTKSVTLTLTRAQVSNLVVSPSTITSGATATGTVTIDAPAPAGGTSVSLAVDKSAASVTSTVVIPAGQTTATFTVFTSSVSSDTTVFISANANNSSRSSSFTVQPARQVPTSVTLNPTSVLGGGSVQGTVQIGAPAPAAGLSVSLTSNNAAATVPGTVLVPAGQTSATFNVATAAVTAPATATITASAGGVSVSSNLTVRVLAPSTLVFSPATVTGGASSTATVTVSDPAPAAGITVLLSSNNVAAKVPASVKIAAGQTSATFVVTSVAVAADVNANITATVGTQALSNTLIVKAPVAQSVTFAPSSVLGGKASVGTVTLNGITAVGGRVVQLRSSNPAIAAIPVSVTVPVGKNVVTFNVTTSAVLTSSDVTITATTGAVEASGTLNVRPVVVKTVVLNPLTVVGPASSVGTITLTEAAPVGGVVVTLSSNSASAVVPASVSIAAGKTSATFTATTKATATPQVATITAGLNGATSTGTLTVTPVLVATLTVAPTSVTGGTSATGTVKLATAPTVDTVVTLTSANTAVATIPATVTVLKGTTSATFTVTTKKPAVQTAVTLSAVTGGAAKTVSVTVKP